MAACPACTAESVDPLQAGQGNFIEPGRPFPGGTPCSRAKQARAISYPLLICLTDYGPGIGGTPLGFGPTEQRIGKWVIVVGGHFAFINLSRTST